MLEILSPEQTERILERTGQILTLPSDKQVLVRQQFGRMYNMQMTILIGISAAQILMTLLQWQKKPIILKNKN